MKATQLYAQLEKDFITLSLSDEWARYMPSIADFLTENFKQRSMGLVCDNSSEINKVYTAVFPSNNVMQSILDKGEKEVMLFVHHPSVWDITGSPPGFQQMDRSLLEKFKEYKISIYNLHVPLDNYGDYSTSVTLAKALGLTDLRPFLEYYGSLAAVFGKTEFTLVSEMQEKFTAFLGHKTSLYQYGIDQITNKTQGEQCSKCPVVGRKRGNDVPYGHPPESCQQQRPAAGQAIGQQTGRQIRERGAKTVKRD